MGAARNGMRVSTLVPWRPKYVGNRKTAYYGLGLNLHVAGCCVQRSLP